MKTKKLKIHLDNMRQQYLTNIMAALSQIKNILFLDINMENKMIILRYQDEVLNNNEIRYLIDRAVLA